MIRSEVIYRAVHLSVGHSLKYRRSFDNQRVHPRMTASCRYGIRAESLECTSVILRGPAPFEIHAFVRHRHRRHTVASRSHPSTHRHVRVLSVFPVTSIVRILSNGPSRVKFGICPVGQMQRFFVVVIVERLKESVVCDDVVVIVVDDFEG